MICMFKVGDIVTGKSGCCQEFGTFKVDGVYKHYVEAICVSSEATSLFTVKSKYIMYTDKIQLLYPKQVNIKNSLNFIVSLIKS